MTFVGKTAKIGKLSTIYMTGSIVPRLVGLFLLPLFTRYLVPEQFGIARLALQIIMPLSILARLGLVASLKSYYFRVNPEKRPQLVRTILQGQAVFAFLFCILLSLAGYRFAETILPNLPITAESVRLLWIMIVWSCFFGSITKLAVRMTQLQERAMASITIALLKCFVNYFFGFIAVVWLGWKGLGRFGTTFTATIVASALAVWIIWRFGKGKFDFALFKKVFKTALTFIPYSFAGVLTLTVNAWLVNTLISTSAIGIYAIAIQFAQFIQLPLRAFVNAAYPTLASLLKEGTDKAKQRQSRLYTLSITGISLLALTLSVLAPLAIDIFVQPAYHQAKTIVPLLVIAWALRTFGWGAGNVIFYYGKGLILTGANVIAMITNIILCFLLIPRFGLYGAALAMLGSFAAQLVTIILTAQKKYPIHWQLLIIMRVLAVVLLLGLLDRYLSPGLSLWLQLSIKLLILAAAIPLLLLCRIVTRTELLEFKSVVVEKLKSFTPGD